MSIKLIQVKIVYVVLLLETPNTSDGWMILFLPKTYVLNTPICEIFEKDIKLYEIITLFDLNHIKSMADHVAISVETQRIDIRYSLEKQFAQ